jgi:hypothetical protein
MLGEKCIFVAECFWLFPPGEETRHPTSLNFLTFYHFQQGYFIGNGTVESVGKQIAALRLKRAGAPTGMTWPLVGPFYRSLTHNV